MDCSLQAGKDISKNPPFMYFTRVPDIAKTVEAGLDKFRNKDRLIEARSVVNNYDGGSLDSGTVHMGVAVQHETLQAMLVGFAPFSAVVWDRVRWGGPTKRHLCCIHPTLKQSIRFVTTCLTHVHASIGMDPTDAQLGEHADFGKCGKGDVHTNAE